MAPYVAFLKENWDKLWTLVLVPLVGTVWRASRQWWSARAVRQLAAPAPMPPANPREIWLPARVKSPYFANQPDGETCVLENAQLLLSARPLNNMFYLFAALESAARAQRPLVVIAPDVTGEVLATLITNHRRGTLICCAVAIAHLPEPQRILRKISEKTGATIFGDEAWIHLSQFTPSAYGNLAGIEAGPESVMLLAPDEPPAEAPPQPPSVVMPSGAPVQ